MTLGKQNHTGGKRNEAQKHKIINPRLKVKLHHWTGMDALIFYLIIFTLHLVLLGKSSTYKSLLVGKSCDKCIMSFLKQLLSELRL